MKKTKIISLFMVLMFCLSAVMPTLAVIVMMGDVNEDGIINSRDMAAIQKHLLQISTLKKSALVAADYNMDGTINSRDIAKLQLVILDVIVPPDMGTEDVTLSNFKSDEVYFVCGQESKITFTVEVQGEADKVELFKNDENIGQMHDDGANGDLVANDDIFTYIANTMQEKATSFEYRVDASTASSNIIEIYYFDMPTESDKEKILIAQEAILNIEYNYTNADGSVEKENVSELLNEIETYIAELYNEEEVIRYEKTNDSISVKFASGYTYVYAPKLKNTYGGSNEDMVVSIYQPVHDWIREISDEPVNNYIRLPEHIDNGADLIPTVAEAITGIFDNYSSVTYLNDDVSLESVKTFSSNAIILWTGHGAWGGSDIHSIIHTGKNFDYDSWLWDITYFLDCCQNRIVGFREGNEAFSAKYVDKYCGDLSNSFVYLNTCNSGKDSILAESFINKGASAVIANTKTILCRYADMIQYTVADLLHRINHATGNYYHLNAALQVAKSKYGENDARYGGEGSEPIIFGGGIAELYRLVDINDINMGALSGKICKASDRITAIPNATIEIYKNDALVRTTTSDAMGNYSINLPAGQYFVKISSMGYIDFKSYATVTASENTYMETFLMIAGSNAESGIARGKVINSLTGMGVEGVALSVKSDWNNPDGTDWVIATAITNANGDYSIELPLGNYTVVTTKDGYTESYFNIIVQEGTTSEQNGTITPVISEIVGNQYLITLTWGANPRDMDSHVVGTLNNGASFHVYYEDMYQYDGGTLVCSLDYDNRIGYGPEHITLNTTNDKPYYYYIHKYEGNGITASSEAKITIEQGNRLIAVFNVPTNLGSDDYWNVFAIKNGKLIISNTITASPNTTYAD